MGQIFALRIKLQELLMLSSVTLNCQATKVVMNSGSQLSELKFVSQMSQVSGIVFVIVCVIVFVITSHLERNVKVPGSNF